jgi:hypothetical protein
MRTLDESSTSSVSDNMKLALYGLYKQAKSGPPPPVDAPAESTEIDEQVRYGNVNLHVASETTH